LGLAGLLAVRIMSAGDVTAAMMVAAYTGLAAVEPEPTRCRVEVIRIG
jgi:hypothetical protein